MKKYLTLILLFLLLTLPFAEAFATEQTNEDSSPQEDTAVSGEPDESEDGDSSEEPDESLGVPLEERFIRDWGEEEYSAFFSVYGEGARDFFFQGELEGYSEEAVREFIGLHPGLLASGVYLGADGRFTTAVESPPTTEQPTSPQEPTLPDAPVLPTTPDDGEEKDSEESDGGLIEEEKEESPKGFSLILGIAVAAVFAAAFTTVIISGKKIK